MVTQNYTISTVKTATPPKVKMSQYDYGMRTITFAVVDGSGAAVDLTGKTVTVEGTRIDGHTFATTCTVADNEATFVDTVDMTNAAGDHPAELVVRESGQRLGTMNFIISVEPCAMDEDAEITEEDKSLFEQLYGVGDAALTAAETLYQHILDNASAPIIYNTSSGSVASFSDGADDYPIKGLTVAVEPVQSGSGDPSPSNVRPISGWSEVKIARCGENLIAVDMLDLPTTNSGYKDNNGNIQSSSTSRYTHGYIPVKPATQYTIKGLLSTSSTVVSIYEYDAQKNWLDRRTLGGMPTQESSYTFTSHANASFIQIQYAWSVANFENAMLVEGSGITETFPVGHTYTISLGETVYGGTLDVVGGKMVVDRAMADLSSSDWTGSTLSTGVMIGTLPSNVLVPTSSGIPTTAIMDRRMAKDYNKISQSDTGYFAIRNNKTVIIPMGRAITVEEFIAEYGDAQLCYPIETPIEITLTPTQINTLLGDNNIYSDAGSISEVEYPADTKQFILNAIASALA